MYNIMCVLFVHFHCLTLIVVIYLQFGSRPTELEVQVRFSLQDNREYVLDNPNMSNNIRDCSESVTLPGEQDCG